MPETVPLRADAVEVRAHLELLTQGKHGIEVRAVGGLLPVRQVGAAARKRGTEVGFFRDLDAAAEAAIRCSDEGFGAVYATLNEVHPDVFARGEGRMIRGGQATQDQDVVRYRNLLLDFDPTRPSGVSATDAELARAEERANVVASELTFLGWGWPLYRAMSGNGYHLVYRLNLEASTGNRKLARSVLQALDGFYSDDHVAIDASVFNPSRVTKIIGTVSRKGDDDAGTGRRWRTSRFETVCEDAAVVPAKTLRALVAKWDEAQGKRGKPKKLAAGSEVDDLYRALEGAGLDPQHPKERDYGTTIALRCWRRKEDNAGGSRPAFLVVSPDDDLRAGCRHATCDAGVGSLLDAAGLRRRGDAGEDGDGRREGDLFATSPEDDITARVNALGLSIVFLPTGRMYVVTPEAGHTMKLRPDDARDYVGRRVEYLETERGLVHPLTVWGRSPAGREAFGYDYDPAAPYGEVVDGKLNLWRGFRYEPGSSRTGAKLFKAWREHLRLHVCAGREAIDAYLWKLLAWKVQNPTTLPMVMPIAVGRPGDGKGVGFLPLVNVFGDHGLHTESPLLGARFNDSLEGRSVVFHDEADHLADPRVMRAMKARVTESRGTYEAKGHSLYQAPSFPLHICATNHPRIRIDAHDRRLLVLGTRSPRGGIEWFEKKGIRELVADAHLQRPDSVAFHRQLLQEALAYDLAGFRPNPPPMTQERDLQILESPDLSVLQGWLMGVLETGELRGLGENTRWRGRRELRATEDGGALHAAYLAHASATLGQEQYRSGFPGRTFSGFAKGFLGLLGVQSARRKVSGRTVRMWRLPTLEEARRRFEAEMGVEQGRDWRDFDDPYTEE